MGFHKRRNEYEGQIIKKQKATINCKLPKQNAKYGLPKNKILFFASIQKEQNCHSTHMIKNKGQTIGNKCGIHIHSKQSATILTS